MMETKQLTDAEIVKRFFLGTTCNRHTHKMLIRGEKFSIIQHRSHAEYTGRFSGTVTCQSMIYIIRNGTSHYGMHGKSEHAELFDGGRVNKKKMEYAKKVLEDSEKNDYITIAPTVA